MLLKLFSGLLRRHKEPEIGADGQNVKLAKAVEIMEGGDMHAAVVAYREYLELDPYHVGALNNLGVCLMDVGDNAGARAAFDLAYSLDDTYVPGVVNHARMRVEQANSTEAMPFLRQAKVCAPEFTHVDAVYASYCLRMGDVVKARHFQKRAWLANFEKMRYANCHLFFAAYDDIDEAELAAEHRFWGETVHPIEAVVKAEKKDGSGKFSNGEVPADLKVESPGTAHKVRIGYWSPDFRNHSVRYFSRPLLENHDKSNFDVFLYHDGPDNDQQTAHIKAAGTHFHEVYKLSDADLGELMRSHQLDILVELAGHTSYNRITLLQQRFATVQITALGYPPTVGLQTIDAKLLDRHIDTSESPRYYVESPLVLPTSFWCFDPMEDAVCADEPPVQKNGYITFACVGNLAKINGRILRCWKQILDRVPGSRLLIRSISFDDPVAERLMRERVVEAGIELDLVDLRKPQGGAAFFESYGEIDIILDTFPFNGGTTTCFATYMGVPVVSLAGASLISRVGLSVLSNLDAPELAVFSEEAYVDRAVELANDRAFIREFRREARGKFKRSALGNGELFAKEFTQACLALLDHKKSGAPAYQSAVAVLPADELVRRAYAVWSQEQPDAAKRILNHCLNHYPGSGSAHLLSAQMLVGEQSYEGGIAYLMSRVDDFAETEQVGVLITIARWQLLQGQKEQAKHVVDRLLGMSLKDDFDRLQVRLYQACCLDQIAQHAEQAQKNYPKIKRIRVLMPCDSHEHFNVLRSNMAASCWLPNEWLVSYERCDETDRAPAYYAALDKDDADILVIVQRNVAINNAMFFVEVARSLEDCDILGIAGAQRWSRLDWRTDEFARKVAGYLSASSEKPGLFEIQLLGMTNEPFVGDLAILDGSLLALRPSGFRNMAFDEELIGAELMLEEDWTHSAFKKGLRLAVHRNLGILLGQRGERDTRLRTPGMMRALDKHDFDPFSMDKDDAMFVSAPVANLSEAGRIMDVFLKAAG